jgi:hypothetical protein
MLAIAACVVLSIGLGIWQSGRNGPAATLIDGSRSVSIGPGGNVAGLDDIPAEWRERASRILAGQGLEQSAQVASLLREHMGMRGADESALIAPVATIVESDTPTFRWRPHSKASSYRIVVVDDETEEESSSDGTAATTLVFPKRLVRGRTYTWKLIAAVGTTEETAPARGKPKPAFAVATSTQVTEIANLRRMLKGSHLLLGLAYVEKGFLDDAEQEFHLLEEANPKSEIANSLLHKVKGLRTTP